MLGSMSSLLNLRELYSMVCLKLGSLCVFFQFYFYWLCWLRACLTKWNVKFIKFYILWVGSMPKIRYRNKRFSLLLESFFSLEYLLNEHFLIIFSLLFIHLNTLCDNYLNFIIINILFYSPNQILKIISSN